MDYSNRNQNDRNNPYNERDQYRQDNDDNYGRNFSSDDSRSRYENYNQDRNRGDDMRGSNDFQNRNRRDQSQSGGSNLNFSGNRGYEGNYGESDSNQWGRQGYNERRQGFENDRNQMSGFGNDRRNYGSGGYNSSRGQNYEGANRQDDRNWFDRTKDEVSSWFGDDDAERRRRMDRMNEGQHRGKGPKGYKRTDERLKEDINDRLSDDPHVDASDIDVTVSNGEVTLTGTVDRRDSKRRAEDLAEQVSGVTHVQNNLRVGQQSGSNTGTGNIGSGITGNTSGSANTGSSLTEIDRNNDHNKARSAR